MEEGRKGKDGRGGRKEGKMEEEGKRRKEKMKEESKRKNMRKEGEETDRWK